MNPLENIDLSALTITRYPAGVLAQPTRLVEVFDEKLAALTRRMFELMYQAKGVGLAGTQVGLSLRLFVANPNGAPGEGEAVYVNPRILSMDGSAVGEEGCLSVPGIQVKIKRATRVTIRAQDLSGKEFEQTGEGLLARIFQHETDHLDGTLVVNRMSVVARLANRRTLKELEEKAGT